MEIIVCALMNVSPSHDSDLLRILSLWGYWVRVCRAGLFLQGNLATASHAAEGTGLRNITVCFWIHLWYHPFARIWKCLGCLDFHTYFISLSSYCPLVSRERDVKTGTIMSLNNFLTIWGETWAPEKSAAVCSRLQQDWCFTCDACWQQGERNRDFEEWVSEYIYAVLVRLMKIQKADEIL